MLVAETHGKSVKSVQGREDLLTSAVFGHLRYVPPKVFWKDVFKRAWSVEDEGAETLAGYLRAQSMGVTAYQELETKFWPRQKGVGEPDMIMTFRGKDRRSLRIVWEVKLKSGKSGKGKNDQLAKYMKLLQPRRKTMQTVFVYLTPSQDRCLADITDTFQAHPSLRRLANRVFGLCWSDLAIVASDTKKPAHPYDMILADVSKLLRSRKLSEQLGIAKKMTIPDAKLMADGELAFEVIVNMF